MRLKIMFDNRRDEANHLLKRPNPKQQYQDAKLK
jgi:hypothetical protein